MAFVCFFHITSHKIEIIYLYLNYCIKQLLFIIVYEQSTCVYIFRKKGHMWTVHLYLILDVRIYLTFTSVSEKAEILYKILLEQNWLNLLSI